MTPSSSAATERRALEQPASSSQLEVSVVMPCLNECRTVGACVQEAVATLHRLGLSGEVVVADNGSTDGSHEIADSLGARVIHVPTKGYGSALQAGIAAARGKFIIMGDADSSYDFSQIGEFLHKLDDGSDLVIGNRFAGGIKPGAMPPLHRYLGNPILTRLGRLLYKFPVRDSQCGLRAFRKDAIEKLGLQMLGMEFASEMIVKAALFHLRIAELPTVLSQDGRDRRPHLRTWRDGWRHLRFLLIYSPRWLFLYPGLCCLPSAPPSAPGFFQGPAS
jgi:glycosyltransferase involved in cell wall biosynthesis